MTDANPNPPAAGKQPESAKVVKAAKQAKPQVKTAKSAKVENPPKAPVEKKVEENVPGKSAIDDTLEIFGWGAV